MDAGYPADWGHFIRLGGQHSLTNLRYSDCDNHVPLFLLFEFLNVRQSLRTIKRNRHPTSHGTHSHSHHISIHLRSFYPCLSFFATRHTCRHYSSFHNGAIVRFIPEYAGHILVPGWTTFSNTGCRLLMRGLQLDRPR